MLCLVSIVLVAKSARIKKVEVWDFPNQYRHKAILETSVENFSN